MLDPPNQDEATELLARAREVRERAYAPYSGYKVGAALRAAGGQVFVGCNVENATYGATVCAERAAVAAMVAGGERQLLAVAVFTDGNPLGMPCGICRQTLMEFASPAAWVVAGSPDEQRHSSLAALLPDAFALPR